MPVYQIDYRDIDALEYTDFVDGDDMYTALSKWRTRIYNQKLGSSVIYGGDEPDAITRWDNAEIIP